MVRAVEDERVMVVLFGALTLALDTWVLWPRGWWWPDEVAVAALVFLVAAGAMGGLAVGLVSGRVARRRGDAPVARPGLRLVRCVLTGALFVHVVPPVVLLVDLFLHPEHLIGFLGGPIDRIGAGAGRWAPPGRPG